MEQNRILSEIEELKIYIKENNSLNFHRTLKEKQSVNFAIKSRVIEINRDINALNKEVNLILIDSINNRFQFDSFIEYIKDKTEFFEENPKIIYQKEKERERQKELEEVRQKEERKRQLFANINSNKRELVKSMYLNGPEDTEKLEWLIDKGYDISDSIIPISRMLENGRTIGFIKFLLEKGMNLTHRDLVVLKEEGHLNNLEFLNKIKASNHIDINLVNQLLN